MSDHLTSLKFSISVTIQVYCRSEYSICFRFLLITELWARIRKWYEKHSSTLSRYFGRICSKLYIWYCSICGTWKVFLCLFHTTKCCPEYEGVSKDTIDVADHVLKRLADEIHNYYIFEKKMPNYASRLYKLKYLSTALDVSILIEHFDPKLVEGGRSSKRRRVHFQDIPYFQAWLSFKRIAPNPLRSNSMSCLIW